MNSRIVLVACAVLAGTLGCGGKGNTSAGNNGGGGGTAPAAATVVYVVQNPLVFGAGTGTVLQFAATASGSVSPAATISAPTNSSFVDVTTDGTGNVYVGYQIGTSGAYQEYAAGSTGSPAPLRSVPDTTTTKLDAVNGAATNAAGELFFALDSGGVEVFSSTATGDVAPTRYILGATQTGGGLSTLIVANAIAADASDNVYVVNEGAPNLMPIVVFGPAAAGNVAPLRTIGGALTQLAVGLVGGVATDSAGNLYVTTSTNTGTGLNPVYAGSILVFAPGATGNVAPIRSLSGASTLLGKLYGIQVDAVGNIYVTSTSPTGTNPTVLKFAAAASGNVAPTSSFTSTAWTHPDPNVSLAIH